MLVWLAAFFGVSVDSLMGFLMFAGIVLVMLLIVVPILTKKLKD